MKNTILAVIAGSLLVTQSTMAEDTRTTNINDYTRCAMLFSALGYSDGLHEVTLMMADKNFSEDEVNASLDEEVARMEAIEADAWTKIAVASCKKLGYGE